MPEGFFSPLHLLILLFSALIVFGIPLLLIFWLARWLDKSRQRRPGVRVSMVAVALGGITDVVASTIFSIPLLIYVMVKYEVGRGAQSSAAIVSSIHSNAWLYGVQLGIGLGCSSLGGYIAARIAKHDELLNGTLSSFLCTLIGIYSLMSGKDSQPLVVKCLLLIAAPVFALLGGYLRKTQKGPGGTDPGLVPSN